MIGSIWSYVQSIIRSESRKAEILRFLLTGTTAVLIQYGFYLLFVTVLQLSPVLSTIISYIISFIANFFLSNLFTFHTNPTKKKFLSFAGSHIINLILQTVLVALFSHYLNSEIALLPAMAICVPCNFVLVRFALKSKYFQSKSH